MPTEHANARLRGGTPCIAEGKKKKRYSDKEVGAWSAFNHLQTVTVAFCSAGAIGHGSNREPVGIIARRVNHVVVNVSCFSGTIRAETDLHSPAFQTRIRLVKVNA